MNNLKNQNLQKYFSVLDKLNNDNETYLEHNINILENKFNLSYDEAKNILNIWFLKHISETTQPYSLLA